MHVSLLSMHMHEIEYVSAWKAECIHLHLTHGLSLKITLFNQNFMPLIHIEIVYLPPFNCVWHICLEITEILGSKVPLIINGSLLLFMASTNV